MLLLFQGEDAPGDGQAMPRSRARDSLTRLLHDGGQLRLRAKSGKPSRVESDSRSLQQ